MCIQNDHLNNLILLGIGERMRYHSPSITAFKSGSKLSTCNRAIVSNNIDCDELKTLNDFYADIPYSIWIKEMDNAAKERVVRHGFSPILFFPVMTLDMSVLTHKIVDDNIIIRPVEGDDELFNVWVPIIAQAYLPHVKGDDQKNYIAQLGIFIKYLQYVLDPRNIHFYLGCFDGVPAATGMFVLSKDFVGVHWIGTLPEFRKRGLGFAVTNVPLHEFKNKGMDKALLFASSSGYPLYEKMGFKRLLNYEVYGKGA